MGIHGSPTCTLVFGQNDGCKGFLLGEEQQGMKLMFHMMNAARIEVGLQGVGRRRRRPPAGVGLRQGTPAEPPLERDEEPGRTAGPDHRTPRRSPHAPDVRRPTSKRCAHCCSRPPTTSTCSHVTEGEESRAIQQLRRDADADLQGLVLGVGPPGHPLVPAGLRRLRLHQASIRPSSTCATSRSPASTKAPTASRPSTSSPASCR